MQVKRIGSSVTAGLLVLTAVVVLGASEGAVAQVIPFPQKPCVAGAAGLCLRTGEDSDNRRQTDGNTGEQPAPAPRDDPPSGDQGGDGGDAPRPPSPAEIARAIQQQLVVEAETFLPQPQVATNPGDGRPSIVDVPTFFAVTNWLPQQVDNYSRGPWWITVTAMPSLSLDPGEPGAPTIPCQDGGTRFDPNGPHPRVQADRPGACAYSYTRRTGAAGRPDAWTARLLVSWTVDWEANFPLPDDLVTFEVLTGTVEREVGEIQSVVTDD